MAREHVKLEIVNENHKKSSSPDNEIEAIFGKPPVTQPASHERHNYVYNINGHNSASDHDTGYPSQPLLEPEKDRQKPPLAGPEIDDLDGDPPTDATPYPGIDDGLLETDDKKTELDDNDDGETGVVGTDGGDHTMDSNGVGTDGKWTWERDEPDYPYDINGLSPRFGADDRPISPIPGVIPDVNTYQQKKNLAQGMMDLALLSANANQLRYVLEAASSHPYYYSSLAFISLSIIFQVAVGVGLIMNSRYDVNDHKEICKADKINNMTVLGIFLITIVNVFITSFGVANPAVVPAQGTGVAQQTG